MFYKTIKNHIVKEQQYYNYIIERRKKRFLFLLNAKAPIEILSQEVKLLEENFSDFLLRRIQDRVYKELGKVRLLL
jgi:hypothetical protein